MKKYITIGEMAKLSGSSIRSLRYYEELEILKPVYINSETNYRYYTIEQLPTLSVIQACVQLNIPLKDINLYKNENGKFDITKLIISGEKIIYKKIEELRVTLQKLNSISYIITTTQDLKGKINPYIRYIKKRYIFFMPFEQDILNNYKYNEAMTKLYKKAEKYNLIVLSQQGVMKKLNNNKEENFIFLEVVNNNRGLKDIIEIQAGNYYCRFYEKKNFKQIQERESLAKDEILFFVDFFDTTLDTPRNYIEVQKLFEKTIDLDKIF